MLKGIGVSEGIVIDRAYVLTEEEISFETISSLSAPEEIERYSGAVAKFIEDTLPLVEKVRLNAGDEESMILEGHIIMVQDPEVTGGIVSVLEGGGISAEAALADAFEMFAGIFEAMEDEIMSQRTHDLRDIKARLIEILTGKSGGAIENISEDCILICRDLTPSDTGRMDKSKIKGIVTEVGGVTSHTAIISRAMEIPTVLSVSCATVNIKNGDIIAVDGSSGEIIINPSAEQMENLEARKAAFDTYKAELTEFKGRQSVTLDGCHVEIAANIGGLDDIESVLNSTAEGVGLFRTEFLFMDRSELPDENAQFEVYKEVARRLEGRSVIIRTLDIGGDKDVPYLDLEKEENPFLGFRAIRLCLGDREMFGVQLRALLRASYYGNIKIMLPMITTLTELREAKALIESLKNELRAEGKPFNENIETGIMVETPAAVMIADLLAKESDFFSIGTNDLTQYTMAVDRGNKRVQYLYSTFDPAVMRAIYHVIKAGKAAGIMVGMCGEGAGDVNMIPFLLAAGLDEFSMSASSVLKARKAVCSLNKGELEKEIEKILTLETKEEVLEFMKKLAK